MIGMCQSVLSLGLGTKTCEFSLKTHTISSSSCFPKLQFRVLRCLDLPPLEEVGNVVFVFLDVRLRGQQTV